MKKYLLIISLIFTSASAQIDSVSNFAQGTLASGISSTATTIILESGHGDRFPVSGYNLTLWDFGRYGTNINGAYRASKAEIIRVTARSGDTLTVLRAQEGTTARTFNSYGTTYYVSLIITKKMITDIRSQSTGLIDSISTHRSEINKAKDSLAVHRTAINALISNDSVDIPVYMPISGSIASQATNYVGFGGATSLSSAEASVPYSVFGLAGRVRAMYIQAKTNTMSVSGTTVTLQYGADTTTASLTPSNLVATFALNQKAVAVTNQSLTVTPLMIGGFKMVNSSGTGSITLASITLIIRVAIN